MDKVKKKSVTPSSGLTPFISKKIRDSGYLPISRWSEPNTKTLTRLSRNYVKTDKCREFNYYPNNKWCKKKERVIIGDNYPCCKYKYLPKYQTVWDHRSEGWWRGRKSRNFSFLYQFCKTIFTNSKSIHDNYLIYGSGDLNVSSYFNHFYQKEKQPINIDGNEMYLLDGYILNPIDITESVRDFCHHNSNYVIWINLISVIFDILPPKHPEMIIHSDTYWNRDMWSLYLTFILFGSSSNPKLKRLVDYDYSNFDNLYRYLRNYDNFPDLKKLVGRDKIIPPWSDFILKNIPEEYLVKEDDMEWGSSFEEPETEEEEEVPLTKEEKKKLRRLRKEEEEEERRWLEEDAVEEWLTHQQDEEEEEREKDRREPDELPGYRNLD